MRQNIIYYFSTLKTEAAGCYEIYLSPYQTKWCHIPEDTRKFKFNLYIINALSQHLPIHFWKELVDGLVSIWMQHWVSSLCSNRINLINKNHARSSVLCCPCRTKQYQATSKLNRQRVLPAAISNTVKPNEHKNTSLLWKSQWEFINGTDITCTDIQTTL